MNSSALTIISVGALVASSCALVGSFLVLRRLAMLGDALSHAVLPGIALAFLWTGSRDSLPMFIGAGTLGLLAAVLVQTLVDRGIQSDAAIGVTFTTLFALGVVLISLYGSRVDLDLDCVLYGEIAYVPFDRLSWRGGDLGARALWTTGSIGGLIVLGLGLFYRQLKVCAFDPEMAAAVGIPVRAVHYGLMTLVSLATVAAFESVGAILVVAMLIVPAATAYLLTTRLSKMLLVAAGLGVSSAIGGYFVARRLDCSISGAMATVAGFQFALALLASPTEGLVTRWFRHRRNRERVGEEDILMWAGRMREGGVTSPAFTLAELRGLGMTVTPESVPATRRLKRRGEIRAEAGGFSLTPSGEVHARTLLRRHRLYESFLGELGYPTDHVHAPADRVEHYLTPKITSDVEEAAHFPATDPQGKPIPPVDRSE